jgi:hypothetical protein
LYHFHTIIVTFLYYIIPFAHCYCNIPVLYCTISTLTVTLLYCIVPFAHSYCNIPLLYFTICTLIVTFLHFIVPFTLLTVSVFQNVSLVCFCSSQLLPILLLFLYLYFLFSVLYVRKMRRVFFLTKSTKLHQPSLLSIDTQWH